jgi:hypothetical protein
MHYKISKWWLDFVLSVAQLGNFFHKGYENKHCRFYRPRSEIKDIYKQLHNKIAHFCRIIYDTLFLGNLKIVIFIFYLFFEYTGV